MSWQAEKARGDEIAYQLSSLGAVTVTRLFGGAALRLDGVMFGFVARGSLFLRVDDVNRPAFVAAGMGPFSYAGRTRTVALDGYYETPADVLRMPARCSTGAVARIAQRCSPGRRRGARARHRKRSARDCRRVCCFCRFRRKPDETR